MEILMQGLENTKNMKQGKLYQNEGRKITQEKISMPAFYFNKTKSTRKKFRYLTLSNITTNNHLYNYSV